MRLFFNKVQTEIHEWLRKNQFRLTSTPWKNKKHTRNAFSPGFACQLIGLTISVAGFGSYAHAVCQQYDLEVTKVEILNPIRVFKRGDTVNAQVTLTSVGQLNASTGPQFGTNIQLWNDVGFATSAAPGPGTDTMPVGSSKIFNISFPITSFTSEVLVYHLAARITTSQEGGNGGGCNSAQIGALFNNNAFTDPKPYIIFPAENVTTTTTPDKKNPTTAGDPVNTFTGELFNVYPDINLGGPMPLLFSRSYTSGFASTLRRPSALGNSWRQNFDWVLTNTASTAEVITDQGRSIKFSLTAGVWSLSGVSDVPYQLAADAVSGNFTLADPQNNHQYIFDATGKLLSIHDSIGNTHTLIYAANGLLTQVADGLGRVLNFTYDTFDQLATVNDGNGRQVSFVHGGVAGRDLLTVTDPLGNVTTFTYASPLNTVKTLGLIASEKKPLGNIPFAQAWMTNATGTRFMVASQTDALNNTTTLAYAGNNTTITDALGQIMTHTHTATGELNNVARRDGTAVTLTSNAAGQRNGITDSLGASTGFAYDAASGRVATTTHANGATTTKAFAARTLASGVTLFDHTSTTHADTTTDSSIFDAAGNVTSRTDRAGNTTSFTRNANGQWLTRTNRLGGVMTRTFNADGTRATSTDVSGNATTLAYDAFRRPITTTFADTSTQSLTYDVMSRPLTITDNRGGVTSMAYDANGNLTSTTNRTGAVTTLSYDAMDDITKTTDANANFSTRNYDVLRRLASTTDRNGNIVSFGYDTQNRLNALTDGNGNISRRSFDTEGTLATTTTPLGNVTSFTSNNMGRITQISSPIGNNVQIAYDTMGRITNTTDPLGNISSNTYDALGLVASRTLPGAISARYTRNALGRITQTTDPLGNNWSRAMDTAGRLTASTDPLARSSNFAFDNRNRISTITFPAGLGTRTNTYDANGNLTRKLFSDGTDLAFTFDAEDRLLTANGLALTRDNLGRITASNGIAMAYDAGGRITSITFAAGKAVSYGYDANNNVRTVTDWVGGTSTFTYDADNRLTSMTRPNGVTTSHTYDIDGRLTGFADGILGSTTLTRNAKGQITSAARTVPTAATATGATSSHSFDAAAQVSTAGFTYDALGRQTNNGGTGFVWDLASRLSSAGGATHTYDGIGYRLSRATAAAGTRNYVWNPALGLPSVSIEKQGAADLRYYVHTPGGALLYSIDAAGNARHFYHFDETGNTRFVSDDAGAVQVSYAYSPFGVVQATTGVLDNPFTWQGQGGIFNDGNGLYYVRVRYYDANTGRFLSKDPIKSSAPKRMNPYQYALNDPLRFVDVAGADPGDTSTTVGTIATGISVVAEGAGSIANLGGLSSVVGGVDLALKSNGIDSSKFTGGVNVGELASEVGLLTVGSAIATAGTAVAAAAVTGGAVAIAGAGVAVVAVGATVVGGVIASGVAVTKFAIAGAQAIEANFSADPGLEAIARGQAKVAERARRARERISRRNLKKTFSLARQAKQELEDFELSQAAKEAALDARLAARRNNAEFSRRDAVQKKGRN